MGLTPSSTIAMKFRSYSRYQDTTHKGFTLVELLVVIMIIMMLSGIIVVAIQPTSSQNLASAQRTLQSLIQSAQTAAVMRNTPTRVIIYAEVPTDILDSEKLSKSHRFMGVVAWNDDTNEWEPVNRGTSLPKGIYFVPPGAATLYTGTLPAAAVESRDGSGTLSTESFRFPSTGSPNEDYYFIEFDSNGLLDSTEHGNFVSLVVIPGSPDDTTGAPTLDGEKLLQATGIYVRRYGNSVMYSDYDMIP